MPNPVHLDDYMLCEAVITPTEVDLRLRRPQASADDLLLRLVLDDGVVTGTVRLDDNRNQQLGHQDRPALALLWRALQAERDRIANNPTELLSVRLDDVPVADAEQAFGCFERLVDEFRPSITLLVEHSPDGELALRAPQADGSYEEMFVHTADLTQQLAALPIDVRDRLAPYELFADDDEVQHPESTGLAAIMNAELSPEVQRPAANPDGQAVELADPFAGLSLPPSPFEPGAVTAEVVDELASHDIELINSTELEP